MNMKFNTLFNLVLASVILLSGVSCLDINDDRRTYTAAEEQAFLQMYLDSLVADDYDIDTTANGVYYVVLDTGEGDFAKEGDTLTVGYAGYFIDGNLFDSSDKLKDKKMEFILGEDSMIRGWEEGMTVINKGARVQLIIPSELAYGSTGDFYIIPPYQTLVFVIKMIDIKPS